MFNATQCHRYIKENCQSNGILKKCSRCAIGIRYKDKKIRIMHSPGAVTKTNETRAEQRVQVSGKPFVPLRAFHTTRMNERAQSACCHDRFLALLC
jgi:hypothetical protein